MKFFMDISLITGHSKWSTYCKRVNFPGNQKLLKSWQSTWKKEEGASVSPETWLSSYIIDWLNWRQIDIDGWGLWGCWKRLNKGQWQWIILNLVRLVAKGCFGLEQVGNVIALKFWTNCHSLPLGFETVKSGCYRGSCGEWLTPGRLDPSIIGVMPCMAQALMAIEVI